MDKNLKVISKYFLSATIIAAISCTGCSDDDDPVVPIITSDPVDNSGFLGSSVDQLDASEFSGITIPTAYVASGATTGPLAPAAYNGQVTRVAQLQQISAVTKDEPITNDLADALQDGTNSLFTGGAVSAGTRIYNKIDENVTGSTVADEFVALADSLVNSSQANFTFTASNGTAGMITTGSSKRHVSANGLEYAQILEKGLFGPLLYDQMVDDYLRPVQAGTGNTNSVSDADYATEGTGRQHAWDEAFGYLAANPATYPNSSNSSTGDGQFIANYTFDFSDETEAAYGINLAQKLRDAFVLGRAALKAGEGATALDDNTNEVVYEAARADIKLYSEAGIAAAANHYLNLSITDVDVADKLHHLSEALGFIYSLQFNSEGRISQSEVLATLRLLGWSSSDDSLNGVYEINLWNVTGAQLQAAKDRLNLAFPGFGNVAF